MRLLILFSYYIRWHYREALKNFVIITTNFIWFLWHFFSIGLLVRTLFLPWQKIHEDRPSGINLSAIFSTLIVNGLMRIAGALIRFFIITLGLCCIIATVIGSLGLFVIWLLLPLVVLFLLLLVIIFTIKYS